MALELQEIFNQTVWHLRSQGTRAILTTATGSEQCVYRGPGVRCAYGYWIPDGDYRKVFESRTADKLHTRSGYVAPAFASEPGTWASSEHADLAQRLQKAHDCNRGVANLKISLEMIADAFGLEPTGVAGIEVWG